jgi:hypothetical protein
MTSITLAYDTNQGEEVNNTKTNGTTPIDVLCSVPARTFEHRSATAGADNRANTAGSNHQDDHWAGVEAALEKHHHQPDLSAARVLYAAYAAHRLDGATVWPMLVAPPGSLKTELLNGLKDLPNVHFVDQLTPQTFLSGQIPDPLNPTKISASLLHRIGAEGVMVVPDFSTMLSGKGDARDKIFADMRRIYDGQLRKEFGTADPDVKREWQGRLTIIVAVTPAIDTYSSVFQSLGERFVMVRWPRSGGLATALAAMNQDNKEAKRELNDAVKKLISDLPAIEPQIPRELQIQIAYISELTVIARTAVARSPYGNKEIINIPEPESATRLPQQLAQLAKGSALLDGRRKTNELDGALVRRAAFDCINPTRSKILRGLFGGAKPKDLGVPGSTLTYAMGDLEALGLIEDWGLSDKAAELMREAGVEPERTAVQ